MGHRLALPLLAAALLVLPGCFFGPAWDTSSGSALASSEAEAARANVRAAIPALEAYYADNGTYAGVSLAVLRISYDRGIGNVSFVGPLNRTRYCLESTVGSATYSKHGPTADVVAGPCPDGSAPPPPDTDAEVAVLQVVPLLEEYAAEHGSYRGLQHVDEVYGTPLGDVRIAVLKRGTAYCVEAPRGAPSAHYVGPDGPLAGGPC